MGFEDVVLHTVGIAGAHARGRFNGGRRICRPWNRGNRTQTFAVTYQ